MIEVRHLKVVSNHIEIICASGAPGAQIVNEKGDKPELCTFPLSSEKKKTGIRVRLPLYAGARYRFIVKGKKEPIKFGRHSRLLNLPNAFIETDDLIIKKVSDEIRVYQKSFKMVMACNYRFNKTLKEAGKGYLIPVRKRAVKNKKRKTKPVVMIADRVNMAGDNGEALFKYLMANGYDKDYDIYFSVIKESDDYSRMSRYGKVLDFGSEEYKDVFLTADYILSSGFDQWFTNAFDTDWKYMTDLYEFEHVFLQHGVTMNDWSKELNSSKRGFKLICTVNSEERNMFLQEPFGYYPDEVALTGFPRYDSLVDEKEKLIVFAPSWRVNLAGPIDKERGSRFYSDKIVGSDYHTFYDSLINDERLCAFMKEHGFKGEFYLHPSFIANDSDFHSNDVVKVLRQADYNRIFRKAGILVTDYSSVNVDFAYLGKPVIYSQFDKDTFFSDHACKPGYFDYEKDGFGPVCTTVDEVVDYIIDRIKENCRSEEKYVERADKFFAYRDQNNCRRVAEAIFGCNDERAIGTTSSRSYKVMDGVLETEMYMTDTQGNNLCVHVLKLDKSADVSYKASCNSYYRDGKTKEERRKNAGSWSDENWGWSKAIEQAKDYEATDDHVGQVIAVSNGDFYEGNGTTVGNLIMEGNPIVISHAEPYYAVLKDGRHVIREGNVDASDVEEAIGGDPILVKDGEIVTDDNTYTEPRQAIGITAEGDVIIACVEGRTPFSIGVTIYDMAYIMKELNCETAINLDGGGSSSFVTKREGEKELIYRNRKGDAFLRNVSSSLLIINNGELETSSAPAEEEELNPGNDWRAKYRESAIVRTGIRMVNGKAYCFDDRGDDFSGSVKIGEFTYEFSDGILIGSSDKDAGNIGFGYCGAALNGKGENLVFAYHEGDFILNIGLNPFGKGNGKMANWKPAMHVPWYSHRGEIREVYIGDGVENIGDNFMFISRNQVFDGSPAPKSSLVKLKLGSSIVRIGRNAFFNTPNLADVSGMNENIKLGVNAFKHSGFEIKEL